MDLDENKFNPKYISTFDGGKCELELYRLSRAFGYPIVKDLCTESEM